MLCRKMLGARIFDRPSTVSEDTEITNQWQCDAS